MPTATPSSRINPASRDSLMSILLEEWPTHPGSALHAGSPCGDRLSMSKRFPALTAGMRAGHSATRSPSPQNKTFALGSNWVMPSLPSITLDSRRKPKRRCARAIS